MSSEAPTAIRDIRFPRLPLTIIVWKGDDEVRGSAHVFAPDGTNDQNPGIGIGWEDDGSPGGRYWIERDDPQAIEAFLRRAAG